MGSTAKNIFWLSVSRILALVLLAVAYIFLFRYLGTFGSGQHQFVLSFVTIFGIIIDFGIQQYVIKRMSEEPDRQKFYFHNFLAIEVILVLVVYAALALVAYFNRYDPVVYHAILVAGLGVISLGLTYPFLAVMSANGDLKKVALINFINAIVNIGFILGTIVFHRYIVFLVANQLTFGIIGLFLYYHFVQKHIGRPEVLSVFAKIDKEVIKKILLAASPFALLVGFSTIYNRIDTVLIYRMLGADQTGLYASAYKFFDLIGFFPSVISFSLYPVFAGLMSQNAIVQIRETIEKYFRILIAIAIPVGVGGSILALQLVVVMAGDDFRPAAPVLSILVWAPAVLLAYIVANSLVISQLTKLAVIITGINVVVNIVGNILLLPHFGIKAAASLTVLSESIQAIFYFYFIYSRITKFSIVKFLWRPIIASSVMGVALLWLRALPVFDFSYGLTSQFGSSAIKLFVMVSLGALVYGLTLAVLKFFKKDDKVFLMSFFKGNQNQ